MDYGLWDTKLKRGVRYRYRHLSPRWTLLLKTRLETNGMNIPDEVLTEQEFTPFNVYFFLNYHFLKVNTYNYSLREKTGRVGQRASSF